MFILSFYLCLSPRFWTSFSSFHVTQLMFCTVNDVMLDNVTHGEAVDALKSISNHALLVMKRAEEVLLACAFI